MNNNIKTAEELALVIEALGRAASRHESEARFNPRSAGPHDKAAVKMRRLRERLLQNQAGMEIV